MIKRFATFALMVMLAVSLFGQTTGHPATVTVPLERVAALSLPALDNAELLADELARRGPGIAPRFAETMDVNLSPATAGTWEDNAGLSVWRLRVPSPGAKSLNFGFTEFFMPAGGQLLLYTPDMKNVQGPFTPADNEEHDQLWTPIVPGDEVVIEVSLPTAVKHQLRLHLSTVNHDFLGFSNIAESVLSGSCNLDVICGAADGWGIVDQYRDIIQSVAVLGRNGNTFCTGFLVSNTRQDCTPFFMTANHCGVTANNAATLVTYWNFINSTCREPGSGPSGGNGDGTLADFNTGAIHRASYAPSDMTLVELDDPVSPTANAWFAGWDARDVLETDTVIAVHHPSTDEKRISFQYDGVYRGSWGSGDNPVADGNHLIIEDWDIGTTEGGSSGSPIFDSDKRVIGQLHGGNASCFNDDYDSYGWFHTSWEGGGTNSTRLKNWLDPDNTGTLVIDGRAQIQCSFFALASPAIQSLCAPDVASYGISVSDNFANTVTLSLLNLPAGLTAAFDQSSVAPGGSTQLVIAGTANAAAGTYTITLVGTDGANSSSQDLVLTITAALPIAPALVAPADMSTGQLTTITLAWAAIPGAGSYDVQLATDASFTNIAAQGNGLATTMFASGNLAVTTTYYWRVRATNTCGVGAWSPAYSFETAAIACASVAAVTTGINIGPGGGTQAVSTLTITQVGEVAGISLTNLATDHTWVGDIRATLTSPSGTTIELFDNPDCNNPGLEVDFSDAATNSHNDFLGTCSDTPPAISGTFQPLQPLSTFLGESATGTWTLTVFDDANQDGGVLTSWGLDICTLVPAEVIAIPSTDEVTFCANSTGAFDVLLGTGFTDDVTLTATGLPSGASANFEVNPATPGSSVNVGLDGFSTAGSYPITIVATSGGDQATAQVVVQVTGTSAGPQQSAPANMATNIPRNTTLAWMPQTGAINYTLRVSQNPDMSDPFFITTTATTTQALVNLAFQTTYYWTVSATNACGEGAPGTVRSFTTTPNLAIGSNQNQLVSCIADAATASFNIGAGFGANPTVTITASPNANFSNFTTTLSQVGGMLSLSWANFIGIAPGSYVLNITVSGEGFNNSANLAAVVSASPALTSLLSPTDGTELSGQAPLATQFTWTAVPNATGYRLEIATDDAFTNIVSSTNLTGTNTSVNLSDAGQFFWRVVALNACGEAISGFYVFSTMLTETVELAGTRLRIWPNPSPGQVQLELSDELTGQLDVHIYTASGQYIRQQTLPATTGIQRLDMADLPAGTYLLRIRNAQAQAHARVVIVK